MLINVNVTLSAIYAIGSSLSDEHKIVVFYYMFSIYGQPLVTELLNRTKLSVEIEVTIYFRK